MILQKKGKSVILLCLIVIIIGGISLYKYIYKPHQKTTEIKASFIGTSKDFIKKVEVDYSVWNTKTVELTGKVSSIVNDGFILDGFIYCQLEHKIKVIKNQVIIVKGTVIGYDDLLNELKLNQCIIK